MTPDVSQRRVQLIVLTTDLNGEEMQKIIDHRVMSIPGVELQSYGSKRNRFSFRFSDDSCGLVGKSFQVSRKKRMNSRIKINIYPGEDDYKLVEERLTRILRILAGRNFEVLDRNEVPYAGNVVAGSYGSRRSNVEEMIISDMRPESRLDAPAREAVTAYGQTSAASGTFTLSADISVGSEDIIGIPKGMHLKVRPRLTSGPKLTVHFQYANDGKTFRILGSEGSSHGR